LPAGDTWGHEAADWAQRVMGIDLLDWQRDLLNDVLLKDSDPSAGVSTWVRAAYWSCSRQNGKTLVAQIISGWFLTEMSKLRGKPVTNIFAAHNTRLAASVFRDSADLLAEHYDISIRSGNGREEISMSTPKGRSKWILVANRENAPRGFTADCVWLDEMQAFSEETISGGFQPTMTARNPRTAGGFPLMLLTGTAGDESSTYQINYRQQAFESIDLGEFNRNYMAEWSAPESADYRKPSTWAYANPGMGETIHGSTLEQAFKTQSREKFIQERCNNMQTSANAWVSAAEWDKLQTKTEYDGQIVLTIDSSIDESRYVGIMAGMVGDKVHLSEAFIARDEKTMWEHVERIMENRHVSLMVTPTLEIHVPTSLQRRYQLTGYAELLRYTGLVQKMIKEKRVTHSGAQTMRDHVLRAALVRTGQGVVLSSQKSSGPIEMARCAVWAVAFISRPQNRQKPMLVVL
jgi:phage terminase large subunit-like protein